MPEKLLNVREAAEDLGISLEEIYLLVDKGIIPAYKIGGRFLRFRKEQIEAIKNEIINRLSEKQFQAEVDEYIKKGQVAKYKASTFDAILDFVYFNDFYIITAILAALIVIFIFKS